MSTNKEIHELPLGEQAAVVLIELLLRVVEKRLAFEPMEMTLSNLVKLLPYQVTMSSVNKVADRVAEYGAEELPGYKRD